MRGVLAPSLPYARQPGQRAAGTRAARPHHVARARGPRVGTRSRLRRASVDVPVRWLRTKIEKTGQPVHLVTGRGVGYRLDPPQR
ncbi:MAG: winged helix-turn-helix domain-containing protein [Candidatus Limnocylindrales bacterium]